MFFGTKGRFILALGLWVLASACGSSNPTPLSKSTETGSSPSITGQVDAIPPQSSQKSPSMIYNPKGAQVQSGFSSESSDSSGSPTPTSTPTPTPSIAQSKEDDVRVAAQNGRLTCNEGNCYPALVLVSTVTPQGLERCSGVLISDHQVLTSDHCIEHATLSNTWPARFKNLSCQNYVYVHFVGDGEAKEQTVGCSSISYRSVEKGLGTEDYAVIELANTVNDRQSISLSNRAFQDHEAATLLRVQMTTDATQTIYGGVQDKIICQTAYQTFVAPTYNSAKDSYLTFGNCPVVSGNSGGPFVNTDGQVGAINQGYLSLPADLTLSQELANAAIDGPYGELAIGIEAVCMYAFYPQAKKSCQAPALVNFPTLSSFLSAATDPAASLFPKLDNGYKWVKTSQGETYVSLPSCARSLTLPVKSIRFIKGLNRLYQPAFLEDQAFPLEDHVLEYQAGDTFSDPNLGSVTLPLCS